MQVLLINIGKAAIRVKFMACARHLHLRDRHAVHTGRKARFLLSGLEASGEICILHAPFGAVSQVSPLFVYIYDTKTQWAIRFSSAPAQSCPGLHLSLSWVPGDHRCHESSYVQRTTHLKRSAMRLPGPWRAHLLGLQWIHSWRSHAKHYKAH